MPVDRVMPSFEMFFEGESIGKGTGFIETVDLRDEYNAVDMPHSIDISFPITVDIFQTARIIPDYWPWRTIALMNKRVIMCK